MKDTTDNTGYFILGIILIFIVLVASYNIGRVDCKRAMEQDAIKNGVAKYEVDDAGNVSFKWKKCLDSQ